MWARNIVYPGAMGYAIRVLLASGTGGVVYLIFLRWMDVEEIQLLYDLLRRKSAAS